jgi:SAM-dependent methyltransferase
MSATKQQVGQFWNRASCGEDLLLSSTDRAGYQQQSRLRYELEPYIPSFAGFSEARGLRVLEIGVGLGADHQCFAEAGADLHGIDLTDRAIEHAKRRLAAFGLSSTLSVGDAEALHFPDATFDVVYSWGVLHHTPNTVKAFQEVLRVLKPGGRAKIMVYQTWSIVGLMLWVRYAAMRLRPWTSMREIYDRYLESPGTKAYTPREARELMRGFDDIRISTVLTHGDLLSSGAGQRHGGLLLTIARIVWPRWLIRRVAPGMGLFMLIEGRKPR